MIINAKPLSPKNNRLIKLSKNKKNAEKARRDFLDDKIKIENVKTS